MDAATLYTIITLVSGEERILRQKFPSVATCEDTRRNLTQHDYSTWEYSVRYSCERHIRLAPRLQTTD